MTASEALQGIISIIGGGGIVTALVAWLAYKTEALKGRRSTVSDAGMGAIGAGFLVDGQSASHVALAAGGLTIALRDALPLLKSIADSLDEIAKQSGEITHQITQIRRMEDRR